jgi:nicotinamidase-related amidase
MRHPQLLDRQRSALAIIDMQEAFRPVINDFADVARRIAVLAEGCQILEVPIVVTEQYPKGLGHTVSEITAKANSPAIQKLSFSACGVQEFDTQLRERHIEQVAICGIETHICVSQTAHDLLARGYQVHIISDATATRLSFNRDTALQRLEKAGAIMSSVEAALFELCAEAGTPEFKAIQKLVTSA